MGSARHAAHRQAGQGEALVVAGPRDSVNLNHAPVAASAPHRPAAPWRPGPPAGEGAPGTSSNAARCRRRRRVPARDRSRPARRAPRSWQRAAPGPPEPERAAPAARRTAATARSATGPCQTGASQNRPPPSARPVTSINGTVSGSRHAGMPLAACSMRPGSTGRPAPARQPATTSGPARARHPGAAGNSTMRASASRDIHEAAG